jgi:hypothetical protein
MVTINISDNCANFFSSTSLPKVFTPNKLIWLAWSPNFSLENNQSFWSPNFSLEKTDFASLKYDIAKLREKKWNIRKKWNR